MVGIFNSCCLLPLPHASSFLAGQAGMAGDRGAGQPWQASTLATRLLTSLLRCAELRPRVNASAGTPRLSTLPSPPPRASYNGLPLPLYALPISGGSDGGVAAPLATTLVHVGDIGQDCARDWRQAGMLSDAGRRTRLW